MNEFNPGALGKGSALRAAWSAFGPWCRCCGRADRHHVRGGLCYVCCDLCETAIESRHHRLSIAVQAELRELPGQCRESTCL